MSLSAPGCPAVCLPDSQKGAHRTRERKGERERGRLSASCIAQTHSSRLSTRTSPRTLANKQKKQRERERETTTKKKKQKRGEGTLLLQEEASAVVSGVMGQTASLWFSVSDLTPNS